ncbi:unnamed protein product [Rotaria magnacalcarata]|uniref:Uncharacterized protein n=1 Tax=Rotaria magnacalcarata TaxID=392030 RepID=A0A8S2P5I6_9BILA|nr:unnamed protein product [Rotaria magnacalcarata]
MVSNIENKTCDEKYGITVEEDLGLPKGPPSLFVCIHFIMMSEIIASITDNAGNYLNEIFGIILSHDTILHDEISRLQKFVDKSSKSLYIYIIDQNQKIVDHLKPSTMQNSQHQHCSYLVVEKNSQSFYPFCVCDVNNKLHTIFSVDDANILKLFTGFSERQLLT